MSTVRTPGCGLRRVVFLVLLGAVVVLLAGPILAVISVIFTALAVVLACAVVGFLLWVPFRVLLVGREGAWQDVRALGRGLFHAAARLPRTSVRIAGAPLRLVARLGEGLVGLALALVAFLWVSAKVVLEVALLAAVGFVLGGVAGVALGKTGSLFDGTVLFNALAGAGLAAVAATVLAVTSRLPRRGRHAVTA